MTTILIFVLLVKLCGVSAWWAALVVLVAAAWELIRMSMLSDIHRKASDAAAKADEARTFALGSALESRRLADAFAPAPQVNLAVAPENPEPLPVITDPERPHNL